MNLARGDRHTPNALRPVGADRLIVFYDGECALCSRFIAWALARDRDARLIAEPAQSPLARERLGEAFARALDELHVWAPDRGVLVGVEAVAAVLMRLPAWRGVGAVLGTSAIRPLAATAYRWVALRRRWFATPACPLPGRLD